MSMTKEEFEKEYAAKSKMTVERLRKMGGAAVPCDCQYELCKGWKMAFKRPRKLPR